MSTTVLAKKCILDSCIGLCGRKPRFETRYSVLFNERNVSAAVHTWVSPFFSSIAPSIPSPHQHLDLPPSNPASSSKFINLTRLVPRTASAALLDRFPYPNPRLQSDDPRHHLRTRLQTAPAPSEMPISAMFTLCKCLQHASFLLRSSL